MSAPGRGRGRGRARGRGIPEQELQMASVPVVGQGMQLQVNAGGGQDFSDHQENIPESYPGGAPDEPSTHMQPMSAYSAAHANGRGRAQGRGHPGPINIQQGELQQEATLETKEVVMPLHYPIGRGDIRPGHQSIDVRPGHGRLIVRPVNFLPADAAMENAGSRGEHVVQGAAAADGAVVKYEEAGQQLDKRAAAGAAKFDCETLERELVGIAQDHSRQSGPLPSQRGARVHMSLMTVHTRPENVVDKRGNAGRVVQLTSNYVKVTNKPGCHLYQYHVSFTPEIESQKIRKAMLKQHVNVLGRVFLFDGMCLILPIRLENETTEVVSVRDRDKTAVKLTIRRRCEVATTSPVYLQVYNMILRRAQENNGYVLVGRNYYKQLDSVPLEHGLEVWPGFTASIAQYETSTMMVIDLSHKILHRRTVLDEMNFEWEASKRERNPVEHYRAACERKILGQIVITRYNNKTYRIDEIAWGKSPRDKFPRSNQQEVSFLDYYMRAYDTEIKQLDQPLLISMPKARDKRRGQTDVLCIIPELCSLTGLDDSIKKSGAVMRNLIAHARVGPAERIRRSEKFISDINSNELSARELRDWNLEFATNLTVMAGRVLQPEKIIMNNNTAITYDQQSADWSKEMRGKRLLRAAPLTNWRLIYNSSCKKTVQAVNSFLSVMQRVCPPMGIEYQPPIERPVNDDRILTYKAELQRLEDGVKIVAVVLPTDRKDRYDVIKTTCCVELGVPSQVMLLSTLQKQGLMSIATKIAIQMSMKMGGEAWAVSIPPENVMVIGIDTYHDSSMKGRSAGAFVATLNSTLTRYFTQCAFQTSHEELQSGLKTMMIAALRRYYAVNSRLPEVILVYRDGVGEGQLSTVYEYEVKQIRDGLKEAVENYNPKLAVIVVSKRINQRFYLNQGNPLPGTIVDNEATRPEWYDFFLVSQSVRQGTVTPTHYNVIYDSTGWSANNIQRMTYKLCHLYGNWQGTIRVPAPCQYAHKEAFIVGQNLHKLPHLALSDKLYYL